MWPASREGRIPSALLLVLKGYIEREKPENVKLLAVHVEHGIRGQEAQEDAEYARHLCEELGVAFRLFSYDVPALAKAEGLSAEEMGRRVRYDSFRRAARELAADGGRIRIAVAHNQGDQAETILWNLSRGSGLSRPVRHAYGAGRDDSSSFEHSQGAH